MTSRIRIRRIGRNYLGTIDVRAPDMDARLVISAAGGSQAVALTKAALLAERIASDPVLSSMLPPQALVAVKAAKMLGKAAQRGLPALRSAWSALRGQGKRRLAAALIREAADNSAPSEVAGFGSFLRTAANVTMNPAYQARAARGVVRRMRARSRAPEPRDDDDDDEEVGLLPLAVLAARYGPDVARAAAKAYAKRKAANAARRKRASTTRAASPRRLEPLSNDPQRDDDDGRDDDESENVDLGELKLDDDNHDDDDDDDDDDNDDDEERAQ